MDSLKLPTSEEQQLAKESKEFVETLLTNSEHQVELGIKDQQVKIPASAFRFLTTVLEHMAAGRAISIISSDTEITTQRAADILNVSRPYLVKLLEKGELPFHKVGTHRRIHLKDVEEYRSRLEQQRSNALDDLIKESQELGLD